MGGMRRSSSFSAASSIDNSRSAMEAMLAKRMLRPVCQSCVRSLQSKDQSSGGHLSRCDTWSSWYSTRVGRPRQVTGLGSERVDSAWRVNYTEVVLTIFESIVRDLRELPPSKLVEVSHYIHALRPSAESAERQRAAIRATAGCMEGIEGEDFERAVRETADRIDADE